jgi:hypothetical protein
VREQLLDGDVLARPFVELRQVLHRVIRELQFAAIHQDHHEAAVSGFVMEPSRNIESGVALPKACCVT